MNSTILKSLKTLSLISAFSLAVLGSAQAAEYTTLDSDETQITFNYRQMNVKMNGNFSKIKATELRFDPAQPENAKVSLEVELASINAGYADANTELAKDEWLAAAQYPLATFEAEKIEAIGEQQYQVTGKLNIKGQSQTISMPFSFSEEADKGIFSGNFSFLRNDFNIGEGQWKKTNIVADDIEIHFQIVAK